MKRTLIIILNCLVSFFLFHLSAETPVTFTETPEDDDSENVGRDYKDPEKGRRTPPARIIGVIDFEAGTLTGTSEKLESIEQYEIWTEEGDACLFAGATAGEMTATLSGLGEGVYMLKLHGAGYVLIGFIER